MKSIFRYPGGKSKASIRNWIFSRRPHGLKEYREPMVGGGAIFWHFGTDTKRWINDKHAGLIEVYTALRDRPAEFIALCREIAPPMEGEPETEAGPRGGGVYNARLRAKFDELKLNEECDQALRYFFVNRTVHGSGRVNYDIPSRLYFSNPKGWRVIEGDALERAAERMAGVKITCGDYAPLFKNKGRDVWVYADPPYVVNGNLTKTSQLYQHSFGLEDHKRFAEVAEASDHQIAISYDDDKDGFARSLFKDWRFEDAEWDYCGTSEEVKKSGKELLIMNYSPTAVSVPSPGSPESTVVMSRDEAVKCCDAIRSSVVGIRGELLKLHEGCGWIALGYKNWRECVQAEFASTSSQMYRELTAARVEQIISPIGENETIPEGWCREIARLDESMWPEVWQRVNDRVSESGEEITAAIIREEVHELAPELKPEPRSVADAVSKQWNKYSEQEKKTIAKLAAPYVAKQKPLPDKAARIPVPEYDDEPEEIETIHSYYSEFLDLWNRADEPARAMIRIFVEEQ